MANAPSVVNAAAHLAPPENDAANLYSIWRRKEMEQWSPDPMRAQTIITLQMRSFVANWMTEVATETRLGSDTLMLAFAYMDRYLYLQDITQYQLQLLGIASLWVAAKYEEISSPAAVDMVRFTDNTYTVAQLCAQERHLLRCLSYDLSTPTSAHFLSALIQLAGVAPEGCVQRMAECMLQLAAVSDDALASQQPSFLAAASLCAALQMAGMRGLLPRVFELAACPDPMYMVRLSQVLYCRVAEKLGEYIEGSPAWVSPVIFRYSKAQEKLGFKLPVLPAMTAVLTTTTYPYPQPCPPDPSSCSIHYQPSATQAVACPAKSQAHKAPESIPDRAMSTSPDHSSDDTGFASAGLDGGFSSATALSSGTWSECDEGEEDGQEEAEDVEMSGPPHPHSLPPAYLESIGSGVSSRSDSCAAFLL